MVLRVALLAGLGILAAASAAAAADEAVVVTQDQAKILRIAAPAATVIIGNPAIADATMQDAQTLVITGKASGTTNLIVLDDQGEAIAEQLVSVTGPGGFAVSVYRGRNRYSYSCAPECQPNVVPGDSNEDWFKVVTDQNTVRTGSAAGSATGTAQGAN
jgi:hypothetical protein